MSVGLLGYVLVTSAAVARGRRLLLGDLQVYALTPVGVPLAEAAGRLLAAEAGADFVGSDDLAAKIQGGWTDFEVAIATPDQMKVCGKLGKILGPRGLMPNPKTGTVTMDLAKTVNEVE